MDIRTLERELSATNSHEEIMTLMKREFAAIGLDQWLYVFQVVETFKTPPCICMATYDRNWLAYYMENGYFHVDPLMKHYTSSSLPLFWSNEDDWSSYGPGAMEFQQDIIRWGYWGGVCTPVFTKEGTRGFVHLDCTSHDVNVIEQAAKASFLVRYFHHHTLRVWVKSHPERTSLRARLTTRETEVMLAVAEGLTSQEIADKLTMSRRTVEWHISSVQEKLLAENRQQAVYRAVNLGLLQPDQNYSTETVQWVF